MKHKELDSGKLHAKHIGTMHISLCLLVADCTSDKQVSGGDIAAWLTGATL